MARWGYRLEERAQAPAWLVVVVSLAAVAAAFAVTGLIFWSFGVDPWNAYVTIVDRTLLDPRGLSEVVRRGIPLLLAGVGLTLAFRAQFWNIGAEGQILAGAVAASGIALFVDVPGPLMIPTMFVAGFIAGGLWGFLPAILKVRLGVNEIITTLMLNYVALYVVRWLITGPWKGTTTVGFAYSDRFDAVAWIPTIGTTRLHWPTLALGLFLAFFVAFILARTRIGFEVRMMGESPAAARYAGVDFFRTTLFLVLFSAGAAGLAGVGEVAGIHHRLADPTSISLGYGYTAIIVALLARRSPLAAIVTSMFIGLIFASGDIMKVSLGLPSQITGVINGLVLIFIICAEPFLRYRVRRIRQPADSSTLRQEPT